MESMVLKIHEDLLNDLNGEIKPIMNDSHIERMLPISLMYMQYTGILKAEGKTTQKTQTSETKLNVFSNVIASQRSFAEATLKTVIAALLQNIKTISNLVTLEKLTTLISQIYYDWAIADVEVSAGLTEILNSVTAHVKLIN